MTKYKIEIYAYNFDGTADYTLVKTINYDLQKNVVEFLDKPQKILSSFVDFDKVILYNNLNGDILYIVDTVQRKYYTSINGILHRTIELFIMRQTAQLLKHGYVFADLR